MGVGVKFGLDAKSISDCLSNYPNGCDQNFPSQWTDEALALQSEGESAELNMLVFSGVGAAAILVGGLLYLSGKGETRSRRRRRVQIVPTVGTQAVGVSLNSVF